MRLMTRVVGLWILLGAYMKLFHGSPVDLPSIARESPLSLSLTFKLIIAIELVVGMLAVLRPSTGWLPAVLLLLAFMAVVGYQISQDEPSCGCFGAAVQMKPSTMLAIDVALFLLFVVSQPWARQRNRLEVPWVLALVLAPGLVAMPWIFDREAKGDQLKEGEWVFFDKKQTLGKPLNATPFGRTLPKEAHIENGLVLIYKNSCSLCAEHMRGLAITGAGGRKIVMLRIPEDPDTEYTVEVDLKPEGPDVLDIDLPYVKDGYGVTPPLHLEIVDGVVTVAVEGMDVANMHK